MYTDIETLFLYRQYVDHPIYNYFDRKSYTIIQVKNPNNLPQSTTQFYEQYIPLFQIDEEKIVNDYLMNINNPKITSHFINSSHYPTDIAEFLIRYYPSMSHDWYKFYDSEVAKAAIAWCEQNHIKYKFVS